MCGEKGMTRTYYKGQLEPCGSRVLKYVHTDPH